MARALSNSKFTPPALRIRTALSTLARMKTLLLSTIAICLLTSPAFPADPPAKGEEKGKLVTRAFRYYPGFIGADAPPVGIRVRTAAPPAHQLQFDYRDALESKGVKLGPDGDAVFLTADDAIVVTAMPEQMKLSESVITFDGFSGPPKIVEVTASLWQFEAPPPAGDVKLAGNLAEIRGIATNLRLLDQLTAKTKSGWRTSSLSKQVQPDEKPAKKEKKPDPYEEKTTGSLSNLGDDHGSSLELEVVVARDDIAHIETNYKARLRLAETAGDIVISNNSTLKLKTDHDAVIHMAQVRDGGPVPDGMVRYRALIISVHVDVFAGLSAAEYEKSERDWEQSMIKKAHDYRDLPR